MMRIPPVSFCLFSIMKKLLQINVVANSGSTGHIAEEIGRIVMANGWESYIAYGRWACASQSKLIRIGNSFQTLLHIAQSFLLDRQGLGSAGATRQLISQIRKIRPDIIHLHNIHGYYLNYKVLFEFLAGAGIPVVWTLHDCWSLTGHCTHFQHVGCNRWKSGCHACPHLQHYPKSLFRDNSQANYRGKKRLFLLVQDLTLVPVCHWLDEIVQDSFLKSLKRRVIRNGIDLKRFYPVDSRTKIERTFRIDGRYLLLGVATFWNADKGLDDLLFLRRLLPSRYLILMVGLTRRQIGKLPAGIIGMERTENVGALVELYSAADVFINPTYQDTLPTVDIEALACGTPVVTYRTGGSSDIVGPETGFVVDRGDRQAMFDALLHVIEKGKDFYTKACRNRAEKYFNKQEQFQEYLHLYDQLISS